MLPIVGLSLFTLLLSSLLMLGGVGLAPAVAHLAFAVGVVPLIFSAMIHFMPVLTRTGDPKALIARLPFMAQGVGMLVVAAMQHLVPHDLLYLAATLYLLLAALLFNWMAARVRMAIASPHPAWRWYGAALGCLVLALLSVLLMAVWPAHWRELRLFHLHLNTIGLVGLAALGTLPVLMPTAIGKPDSEAGHWLLRNLWLVAGGALVIASGSAVIWPFAVPGAALVFVAVLVLLGQWFRRFGIGALLCDGVSASLVAALGGLLLALAAGVAHGAGLLPGWSGLLAWGIGFLLPLVTGALSQLLPVWRWPGPLIPARLLMRQKLAAGGAWRAGLFFSSAASLLAGFEILASCLLLVGLGVFLVNLLQAVRVTRSTR